MEKTYLVSLVFTTQRKRKVFVDEGIMDFTRQKVKEGLAEKGAILNSMEFHQGCVAVAEVGIPLTMSIEEAFNIIKKSSNFPIMKEYPKYSKMVSIWTKNYWAKAGKINKGDEKEIHMFILRQRDR